MNFRVFLLAISAFVVGLAEMIIGGILPLIASNLNVSVAVAGQLITVFALSFSISGPILLSLTSRVERKKLYLLFLGIFSLTNFLAYISPTYEFLLITRIFMGMSASIIIVLSLTIVPKIVDEKFRSRSIGIVLMGVSSALVLGVPFGVVLGELYGWRIFFLVIGLLSLVVAVIVFYSLKPMKSENVASLGQVFKSLKNKKILTAHIASLLFMAGHYTLYSYLAPFLETTMQLATYWVSLTFFIYGLSAVFGGGVGGWISDKIGSSKTVLVSLMIFILVLTTLPLATYNFILFVSLLIIWGLLSWAVSPALQMYFINITPETSDIQQSIHTSFMQLGMAFGSAIGGVVVQKSSVVSTAWVGAGVVLVGLLFALYSFRKQR